MTASVLWGANNIFSVRSDDDGRVLEGVRIKGKQLQTGGDEHNVLAPGDRVRLEESNGSALIAERLPRRNRVVRWNRTRHRLQAMAANVDELWIVTSGGMPMYRPGFVDQVLVMAELEALNPVIVVNKADLELSGEAHQHLAALAALNYPIVHSSVPHFEEQGQTELRARLLQSTVALIGPSGVGKSSLVNALIPEAGQSVGDVSRRYRRGRHTTTLARQVLLDAQASTTLIDTPGVREFDLFGYRPGEIARGFRELWSRVDLCRLPDCSHIHEPDCAIREAVEAGVIAPQRYRSYTRIMGAVEAQQAW